MANRKSLSTCVIAILILLILVNLLVVLLNLGFIFSSHQPYPVELAQRQSPHRAAMFRIEQLQQPPTVNMSQLFKQDSPVSEKSKREPLPPYQIRLFVLKGQDWGALKQSWPVCLSTAVSVDQLFWVAEQVRTWMGPVSIAVYVPDSDFTVASKMMEMLISCNSAVRKRVSFHMVYHLGFSPRIIPLKKIRSFKYNCDQLEMYNEDLVAEMNGTVQSRSKGKVPLPRSLLRNVAKDSCESQYVFMPDADMVLVVGISHHIKSFFNRKDTMLCKKCAFIIPVYEISTLVHKNPVDKSELLSYLKKRLAKRFPTDILKANQDNSQLKLWEHFSKAKKWGYFETSGLPRDPLTMEVNGSIKVLYDVKTWENFWEPFYISEASVPDFDERFSDSELSRSGQVYEMHLAGYRWRMLNDAFLCYRGFQHKNRRDEWPLFNYNFHLYQDFKLEKEEFYGLVKRNQNTPDL